MYKWKLYDKREEEMFGPFTWDNIEAVVVKESMTPVARAVIRKDNRMIRIKEIPGRYLVRPEKETKEEFEEKRW